MINKSMAIVLFLLILNSACMAARFPSAFHPVHGNLLVRKVS